MNWEVFTQNLQATLPHITDRCFLVIATPDRTRYVQFAASSNGLTAETTGPEFASSTPLRPADSSAMVAAGWTAPTPASPNWVRDMPLPALSQEFAELAEHCTAALRELHQVESPDTLSYRAWREPEYRPAGEADDDWLDPGEDPLQLPTLGLPPTAE